MNRFSTQYQPTNPFQVQSDVYRYGFNGKEKDFEIDQNNYDFGSRAIASKLGIWHSIDPRHSDYAAFSPYAFVNNNPISMYDPDGEYIKPANRDTKNRIDNRLSNILGGNISLLFGFENPLVNNQGSGTNYSDYNGQNRPIPVITVSNAIRAKLNTPNKSFNVSYRAMRRAVKGVLRDNKVSLSRENLKIATNYALAAASPNVYEVVFIDEQITMNDSNVDMAQGDATNDLGPYVTTPINDFMTNINRFENSNQQRNGGVVNLTDPVLVAQKTGAVLSRTTDNGGSIQSDPNNNNGTTIFIDSRSTDSNGTRTSNVPVSEQRLDDQIKKAVNGK